jgi:hypothetical protein
MATAIQTLLNAIPTANDGDAIGSNYHNSLRDAVVALANLIGTPQPSPAVIVTVVPAFATHLSNPPWIINDGFAVVPAGGSADGILPVHLPDGLLLDSMTVLGRRSGSVTSFDVLFSRQVLSAVKPTPLIALDLSGASDPFTVTSGINITDPGAGGPEAFQVINNAKFKYFVTASVSGATTSSRINIFAFQFKCVS